MACVEVSKKVRNDWWLKLGNVIRANACHPLHGTTLSLVSGSTTEMVWCLLLTSEIKGSSRIHAKIHQMLLIRYKSCLELHALFRISWLRRKFMFISGHVFMNA